MALTQEDLFRLKSAKGRITQAVNNAENVIGKADAFKDPFIFPQDKERCFEYVTSNLVKIRNIITEIGIVVDNLQNLSEKVTVTLLEKIEGEEEKKEAGDQLENHMGENNVNDFIELGLDTISKLYDRITDLESQQKAHLPTSPNPANTTASVPSTIQPKSSPLFQAPTTPIASQAFNPVSSLAPLPSPALPSSPNDLATALNNLAISLGSNQSLSHLYNNTFKIPDFNGKPSEFNDFYNLFIELVDKKSDNSLEKLSILLSTCKGEAKAALELIPRTPAGYHMALQRLKTLFSNPYAIRNELIAKLEKLERATDNQKSLLRTLTTVQTIATRLSSAGDEINSGIIQKQILSKFPGHIREKVLEKQYEFPTTPTTQELLTMLETVVKLSVHQQMYSNSNF